MILVGGSVLIWGSFALADSLALPPAGLSVQTLDQVLHPDQYRGERVTVTFGASGSGDANLRSLLTVSKKNQPSETFNADTANVNLNMGEWLIAEIGHWRVGFGEGENQTYSGNHDAGQYWLDSHSTSPVTGNYSPQLALSTLKLNWYGAGYTLPFRFQELQGSGSFMLRGLTTDSFQTGSAIGSVDQSQFSGMSRLLTTNDSPGLSIYGWSLDAGINVQASPHWRCAINGEGLAGELTLRNISTWDLYLTSPQVFTDPDGFFHNYYSADGAKWQQNVSFHLQPVVSAMVGYGSHTMLFAGMQSQADIISPQFGVSYPWSKDADYTLSLAPREHTMQFGYLGKRFSLSIALDNLTIQAVRNAQLQAGYRLRL